jgi:hypothetical protein
VNAIKSTVFVKSDVAEKYAVTRIGTRRVEEVAMVY